MTTTADIAGPSGTILTHRHSVIVRIAHWTTALALFFLLLSGLQIFNAHPHLYWGQYGADADKPWLSIGAVEAPDGALRGQTTVAGVTLPTTGVLGVSEYGGEQSVRAFPAWATIPSGRSLAEGRRWHFFFAWVLGISGLVYIAHTLRTRHLQRDIIPARAELSPAHIAHEILDHARLNFPKGEEARRYNTLQKLAYFGVIGVALPGMVLTGLTMSPGVNAAAPWMLDLFGGRASARSLHFIFMVGLVAFFIIHIVMVFATGPINNMRAMTTGRFAIRKDRP